MERGSEKKVQTSQNGMFKRKKSKGRNEHHQQEKDALGLGVDGPGQDMGGIIIQCTHTHPQLQ